LSVVTDQSSTSLLGIPLEMFMSDTGDIRVLCKLFSHGRTGYIVCISLYLKKKSEQFHI